MKKYIITNNKERFIKDGLNESYDMEYTVWVLDGDDNRWKPYKGSHTNEIDKDTFLKSVNHRIYPNFDIISNFIDVKVLPAGESPIDESYGKTTSGKTIEGEFSKDNKTFTDKNGNVYHVNDGGEIIEE